MMKSLVGVGLLLSTATEACSNILVSRGASADNSTIYAYDADEGSLFGSLGYYPAADHAPDAKREVWDWDGSFFLGYIPEVKHTYNVVGNVNEHGLMIGETTFGGLGDIDGHGTDNKIDYGSLIWITLQRSKTAREAIAMMDSLTQTHGYASDGESFSIADQNEIWLLEMVSKGKYGIGSVWVASRVPEGMMCAHSNQARTTTWDHNDPENVMFAKDVVTFAQSVGLYPQHGDPNAFSFAGVYDPMTFGGARFGEARAWNMFNEATVPGTMDQYLDFAQGYNLTNRMPLFQKPKHPLTVTDVMTLMRTHFEGSWFDNRGQQRPDVGAGPGNSAYRWRPLTWTSGGNTYLNERTVGTQQTAWNFVGTSRGWLPGPIAAQQWFAPDDSSTALRIPTYGCATRIPPSFGDTVGQDPNSAVSYAVKADAYHVNLDHAFWVWNLVAQFTYGERAMEASDIVQREIAKVQAQLMADAAQAEATYISLYNAANPTAANEFMTNFTVQTGEQTMRVWSQVLRDLQSRFRDGFTITPNTGKQCVPGSGDYVGCTSRMDPKAAEQGYTAAWAARIVADSDNAQHYLVPASALENGQLRGQEQRKLARMQKRRQW